MNNGQDELTELKEENRQLLIQLEIATNGLRIATRNQEKLSIFFKTAVNLHPDLVDFPGIEDMELEEIPQARFSHGHCKGCRKKTGYLRPLLKSRQCPICGWQRGTAGR